MTKASKYTKDLILKNDSKKERLPLYNPEALKIIEKEFIKVNVPFLNHFLKLNL